MPDHSGQVVFPGAGPHWIPTAQSATATGAGNGVTATLYCLIPEKGPRPSPVTVQMSFRVARSLGHELVDAALASELASLKGT